MLRSLAVNAASAPCKPRGLPVPGQNLFPESTSKFILISTFSKVGHLIRVGLQVIEYEAIVSDFPLRSLRSGA